MKSIIKVTCTTLLFTGLMAGCNGNTAPKQEKALLKRMQCTMGKYLKRIL